MMQQTFELTEEHDVENAHVLLESANKEMKNKLKTFIASSINTNQHKVTYVVPYQGRITARNNTYNGKIMPNFSCSGGFDVLTRGALAKKYYHDIDMVNSSFMIALNILKKIRKDIDVDIWSTVEVKKISYDNIQKYIEERSEIFAFFMSKGIDNTFIKEIYVKAFYGSDVRDMCDAIGFSHDGPEFKYLNGIQEEIAHVMKFIFIDMKALLIHNDVVNGDLDEYDDDYIKLQGTDFLKELLSYEVDATVHFNATDKLVSEIKLLLNKDFDWRKTWTNLVFTYETKIIMCMKDCFEQRGFEVGAVQGDGMYVRRKEEDIKNDVLVDVENYVKKHLGFRITLIEKEMSSM